MTIKTFPTILFGAIISLISCQKETNKQELQLTDNEVITVINEDDAATNLVSNLIVEVEQTLDEQFNKKRSILKKDTFAKCKTVIVTPIEPTIYPKNIEINYNGGCSNKLNYFKTGIIKISLSKPYTDSLSERQIILDNYSINGHKIEGNINATYNKKVIGSQAYLNTTLNNIKITFNNGKVNNRQSIKMRVAFFKIDDRKPNLDIYWISGEFKVTNSQQQTYLQKIGEAYPLVLPIKWPKILGGSYYLKFENAKNIKTIIIDYNYSTTLYQDSKAYTDSAKLLIDGKKVVSIKLPPL